MEKRLLESIVKQSFGEESLEKIVNQCEVRLKTTQDAWMKRKTDEIADKIVKIEEEKKRMVEIVKDSEKAALKVSAIRPLLEEQISKKILEINNNEKVLKQQVELLQTISSQTYQDVDNLTKTYKAFETK